MSTKVSRSDVSIHNTLTTFFTSQDGETPVHSMYHDIMDLVFKEHTVIWAECDVKSVIRAAKQRGGALEMEDARDEAVRQRYEEAKEIIANSGPLRSNIKKAKERFKPAFEAFEQLHPHHHQPLSLAQRRLHHAMQTMAGKSKARREAKEAEEKDMQELVRQKRKADEIERKAKRSKEAAENSAKKAEEAAERQRKEAQNTRAINNKKAKDLREHNKDTYRRKREEAEDRAKLVKIILREKNSLDKEAAEKAPQEKKSEAEVEEGVEEEENFMPE